MTGLRSLLIFQLAGCLLLTSVSGCNTCASCQSYVGWNGCISKGVIEPKLPPRDNACCGPHCTYTAPNAGTGTGPCNTTPEFRCLLDTHCGIEEPSLPFTYRSLSDCDLIAENQVRLSMGYARLLSFPFNNSTCQALNTKCGTNCCCRENCPTMFCKF
ncbi:hypothetical protein KR009_000432 [Drosophila setifemur]|nr:hypothetical protein KR009_000432 [Drosophila setifemur]